MHSREVGVLRGIDHVQIDRLFLFFVVFIAASRENESQKVEKKSFFVVGGACSAKIIEARTIRVHLLFCSPRDSTQGFF